MTVAELREAMTHHRISANTARAYAAGNYQEAFDLAARDRAWHDLIIAAEDSAGRPLTYDQIMGLRGQL